MIIYLREHDIWFQEVKQVFQKHIIPRTMSHNMLWNLCEAISKRLASYLRGGGGGGGGAAYRLSRTDMLQESHKLNSTKILGLLMQFPKWHRHFTVVWGPTVLYAVTRYTHTYLHRIFFHEIWVWYAFWTDILYCTVPQHDDVIKWEHFPRYWPFVRGTHRFLWSAPE